MPTIIKTILITLLWGCFTVGTSFADSGFCSLLLKPPFSKWNDSDLVVQSRKNLEYLQNVPYHYTSLLIRNRTVIRGLPMAGSEARFVPRALDAAEMRSTLFRHYTTPEGFEKILERKRLVAGPVSYVSSPYVYPDVTGIFLTTSKFKPETVGLDSAVHSKWVDFHLPEGTGVLWLEPGIYVVPGSVAVPEWLIRSVKSENQYSSELSKLSTFGYSAMEIPILLVR